MINRKPFIIVVIFIGFLVVLNSVPARYNHLENNGPNGCLMDLIRHDVDAIDIAVVGSSRMLQGVDPFILENRLSAAYDDKEISAYNFAISGRDIFSQYMIVKDVLSRSQVKLLIAEIYLPQLRPREVQLYGQYIVVDSNISVGTYGDLFRDGVSKPDQLLPFSLRDSVNATRKKIDNFITLFISRPRRNFLAALVKGPNNANISENKCYIYRSDRRRTKKDKAERARFEEKFAARGVAYENVPDQEYLLDDVETKSRVRFYLKEMERLVEKQGGKVLFTFVPTYLETPPSAETVAHFEENFNATFMFPDREYSKYLFKHHRDSSHLLPKGKANFTGWLSRGIKEHDLLGYEE